MLYNPHWSKPEVKADPFKLETLIAWLEKQPSEKTYNYGDCDGMCLYGQYMRAFGISWDKARKSDIFRATNTDLYHDYRHWFYVKVAVRMPHTFGAALERARALHCAND